jgi:hypothetical protein
VGIDPKGRPRGRPIAPAQSRSEETRIGRRAVEAIVAAIDISDRRGREFVAIEVVEQGNLNCVESATYGFHFASPRRADSAIFAEKIFNRRSGSPCWRPLVVPLRLGAGGEAIAAGRDEREPGPRLDAARAVALYCPLGDVDFGFEANSAAVAAAGVSFQRHVGAFI